ncbi:MAG: imidazoleglycerol-phosphate dehydratase HisB [Proteobacteria bacterium]|jgi:imidazoleglycerol-phosphate dehydratase/histidinol-phosphatase|nr:imidazoleglycerol-phosphate dehydratase HisB [Pseudomonadota bacterium]
MTRLAAISRETKETRIGVAVNLDGCEADIKTGLGFFDHMLDQIARHAGIGLTLHCRGDLQVDAHHTIEDSALALGEAINKALGNKRGLARYGFTVPMDESLARVALDLSGRPYLKFEGTIPPQGAGEMSADMVDHFFRSLTTTLQATIHINVTGENAHHMIEACFKAFARALKQAIAIEGDALPSTKGTL